jgi:hypothetical protein
LTDTERRLEVLAAHARLEAELRAERRHWLRAAAVAALLTVAGGVWWIGGHVLSKPRLGHGTVSLSRQIPDDYGHTVYQVVELDDGRSVMVSPRQLAPIGARVIVSERTTWWGRQTFSLVGPEK